jgi:tRNA (guanine37-N1)-methyltransferase
MKVLPINLITDVRRSYDLIGDIAIIEIPDSLKKYEKVIANSLLKTNPKIKVVAKKPVKIEGKYRIRKLKILAGERRTTTEYRESDCVFRFDLNKTYFSQRLGNERLRIAEKIKGAEKVLVMFSGIAPFGIIIAKKHPYTEVWNIELNPAAAKYAEKNIKLNRLESRVFSIKGDVSQKIFE